MKTKHTKGTWKVGNRPDVVVTDNGNGFQANTGHDDVDYYGGFLIAESILKVEDAKLIAAAPELLEACFNSFKTFHSIGCTMDAEIMQELKAAIKKATELTSRKA